MTDGPDDGVVGNQTVLGALGDRVVFKYARGGDNCEDRHEIDIGRPVTENNNGADQLLHDIRELKVNVVVFSRPGQTLLDGGIGANDTTIKVDSVADAHQSGFIRIEDEFIQYNGLNTMTNEFLNCTRGVEGTTAAPHADNTPVLYSRTVPAVTRLQVNADLITVDERFAQATIRLKRDAQGDVPLNMGGVGDPGVVLPPVLLDGFTPQLGFMAQPNADESAVIALKDNDANSIDVFYVDQIVHPTDPTRQAESYPAIRNQTGNAINQNFFVIQRTHYALVPPHEIMHILLNSQHRLGEPNTALFYFAQGPPNAPAGKVVHGPKRIGPYPDAQNSGVGTDDTFVIRDHAESLP